MASGAAAVWDAAQLGRVEAAADPAIEAGEVGGEAAWPVR